MSTSNRLPRHQAGRRIGRALARLFAPNRDNGRLRATPACEFGLLVEERLKDMGEDLASVKALLRALLLAMVGGLVGLVVDILIKVAP